METADLFVALSNQALLVGLATTRIAVAFLLLPVFTNELVPALVRNAIFVAFALIAIMLQPAFPSEAINALGWITLFAKEALVGVAIGVLFGIFLWAFEAAGQVIDTQIGATMAQVVDPLSGQQTSLTGAFLGRLANFMFMAAGGLLLLLGILLESFALWPMGQPLPDLAWGGLKVFEAEFSHFFRLTLLIAAPMLVVLFIIDGVLGMVNRYAQQLNVFFLSMSLKALAAVAILLLMVAALMELLVDEIVTHYDTVPGLLRGVLGG
jgi:type III secretion protein T